MNLMNSLRPTAYFIHIVKFKALSLSLSSLSFGTAHGCWLTAAAVRKQPTDGTANDDDERPQSRPVEARKLNTNEIEESTYICSSQECHNATRKHTSLAQMPCHPWSSLESRVSIRESMAAYVWVFIWVKQPSAVKWERALALGASSSQWGRRPSAVPWVGLVLACCILSRSRLYLGLVDDMTLYTFTRIYAHRADSAFRALMLMFSSHIQIQIQMPYAYLRPRLADWLAG
jgi:hypothetical protein